MQRYIERYSAVSVMLGQHNSVSVANNHSYYEFQSINLTAHFFISFRSICKIEYQIFCGAPNASQDNCVFGK